jgi:hypothetical protein
MVVLASTQCVTERQVERTVADRLSIMISRFMSSLQVQYASNASHYFARSGAEYAPQSVTWT